MTVLIVEDDVAVRGLVCGQLETRGVTVTAAGTAAAGRDAMRRQEFEIVILDLTLPDGSGLDVLEELRRAGSTAHVIILSGATTEGDRVRALELGADDYVVKPFFTRELIARVLAVRRRRDPDKDARLRVGHLDIDLAARRVSAEGRSVDLTSKEFDLLAFLATRPGHVFSRDELLRAVWQSAPGWQQGATVTEHIRRLRSKIERDPREPQLLSTVRGAGYRFDVPIAPGETNLGGHHQPVLAGTVIHVDGQIVFADRAAAELVGYATEAELVGKNVLEFAAPVSLDAAREYLRRSQSGHQIRSQVFSTSNAHGTEVMVEATTSPTVWGGQPAVRMEVTEVPDSSSRLRHLVTGVFSELSDAVIVTDLHFHIRSWNHAAQRLYGWTEAEVRGRHLLDVISWKGDEAELAFASESLETTGRWHGVAQQITRDGSTVVVRASTTLVRDDRGEPIGIVSVNRPDIGAAASDTAEANAYDDAEIRRGLDHDEFEVYYQPVVSLADQRIATVEALVRWNHPDRGVLIPAAFIATAERSGLIVELGAVVFEKACRQTAEWRRAGASIELAVNLSTRELADEQLVDRITTTLSSTGLEPSAVWLEVTETSLVDDVDQATHLLNHLAELGIRFSIDDFGTGWASLTYLKQFPIHALKIDRIFVDGIDRNANDAAIVRSILSLGKELGLFVVAEGIETVAQQKALIALGCSLGQGFLYGKPTPAGDVPVDRAHRLA